MILITGCLIPCLTGEADILYSSASVQSCLSQIRIIQQCGLIQQTLAMR